MDTILALDNKAQSIKFAEGNGSETLLTPRQAFMKRIELRKPRNFSEKMKQGAPGTSQVKDDLAMDKAEYELFCEQAGELIAGTKDVQAKVWEVLAAKPELERKMALAAQKDSLQRGLNPAAA